MPRQATARKPSLVEAPVWPVLNRELPHLAAVPAIVDESLHHRGAEATPDVPGSVGILLFGSYLALIGALSIATAGPGESKFVIAIAGLFVLAFFSVPRLIFAQEPKEARRPSMSLFLARGLNTYTGKCSGRDALVQMFIVPILLTFGVLAIAVVIALS